MDLDEKITPKTGLAFLADPLALWALGFAVLSLTLLPFDRDLVRILNPATPGPADSVALFMDHLLPRILLGLAVPVGVSLWVFGARSSTRRYGLALSAMPLVANRLAGLLKLLAARPRPQLEDWGESPLRLLVELGDYKSFPSGHVTTTAAIVIALCWMLPIGRWRLAFVLLVPAMMWDRVVCALHYPSDTAAGSALACACAWLWRRLVSRLDLRVVPLLRGPAIILAISFVAWIWREELGVEDPLILPAWTAGSILLWALVFWLRRK